MKLALKRLIEDLRVQLFRSCNMCMLFKIVKLVCQESKGKIQVVEHQENFNYLQNLME